MEVGAFLPIGTANASADFLRMAGPAVEERGFESIWVGEHVVLFDEYQSQSPDDASGHLPGDSGLLEPLTALTYLAAVTDTVRLGTGICLVPQRHPVYTAKQVADLDVLSGGRVDFGVGVGWLREEYDALQVPFEHRGARCRDFIGVMRALWCDDPSEFRSESYNLRPSRMYPKPVQKPHPPIHFGGETDAALRRVADMGQGWYSFNLLPEDLPEPLVRLDRLLEERGRSRIDVQLTVCPNMKPVDAATIDAYEQLGVDRLVLPAYGFTHDALLHRLDQLAVFTADATRPPLTGAAS